MLCWDRWACLFIFREKKYVEKKRGKTFEAFISSQNNWICVDKVKKWKKLLPEFAAKCLLFIIYFAPKLLTPPPLRINHIQLFHFPILLIEKFSTALQKEEKLIFKYIWSLQLSFVCHFYANMNFEYAKQLKWKGAKMLSILITCEYLPSSHSKWFTLHIPSIFTYSWKFSHSKCLPWEIVNTKISHKLDDGWWFSHLGFVCQKYVEICEWSQQTAVTWKF